MPFQHPLSTLLSGVMAARGMLANPAMFAEPRVPSLSTITASHPPQQHSQPAISPPVPITVPSTPSSSSYTSCPCSRPTPLECVREYVSLALQYGGPFVTHHRHLQFMLYSSLSRAERDELGECRSLGGLVDFMRLRGWWHDNMPDQSAVSTLADTFSTVL